MVTSSAGVSQPRGTHHVPIVADGQKRNLVAKRLEQAWVVIDKRWSESRDRWHHQIAGVFGDRRAAHEYLDDIEATDYDRNFRDVVVVPFEVLYEAPRWRDLWQIEHASSPRNAAVPKPIRVFEHDDPRWFRSDISFPTVEGVDPQHDSYVCIIDETDSGCLEAFEEIAVERGIEYYKPVMRMPGALPQGKRRRAVAQGDEP